MKEQLQQIQAVALVTFLCVLISVHSDGDYGKWFVIEGIKQDITYDTGENGTLTSTESAQYSFSYSYYLNYYEAYDSNTRLTDSIGYQSPECLGCTNQGDIAGNIKLLAYGTAIVALSVAYMARN